MLQGVKSPFDSASKPRTGQAAAHCWPKSTSIAGSASAQRPNIIGANSTVVTCVLNINACDRRWRSSPIWLKAGKSTPMTAESTIWLGMLEKRFAAE
ncbi:hypothetical protein D9M70_537860 [compost metagenome]